MGCTSLEKVYVPETITYIDVSVFTDCDSLSDVYFGGTTEHGLNINYHIKWDVHYTVHCSDGSIDENGNVTYK